LLINSRDTFKGNAHYYLKGKEVKRKMTIEVVKMPDGPAPAWVREKWVGIRMEAERTPAESAIGETDEEDFTSGKRIPSRGGYIVSVETALTLLALKSLEAARWFEKHIPAGMVYFSFGPNEARVV